MTEDKKENPPEEANPSPQESSPIGEPAKQIVSVVHSSIHLGRIDGMLQVIPKDPEEAPHPPELVRVMFSYLTPRGVSLYSKIPLERNTSILLKMKEPSAIEIKAIVSSCSDKSNSGSVVSSQKFPYKVMLKFEFSEPQAVERLKAYIQELKVLFHDN